MKKIFKKYIDFFREYDHEMDCSQKEYGYTIFQCIKCGMKFKYHSVTPIAYATGKNTEDKYVEVGFGNNKLYSHGKVDTCSEVMVKDILE